MTSYMRFQVLSWGKCELWSSGLRYQVVLHVVSNVSEESITSIIWVKSLQLWSWRLSVPPKCWDIQNHFYPEHGGNQFLRNNGNHTQIYNGSQTRRAQSTPDFLIYSDHKWSWFCYLLWSAAISETFLCHSVTLLQDVQTSINILSIILNILCISYLDTQIFALLINLWKTFRENWHGCD
jgi:hypothetical protein